MNCLVILDYKKNMIFYEMDLFSDLNIWKYWIKIL